MPVTGYGAGNRPLAVAHRGGAGIGLENTMQACQRSWALGVRYLEVDIRLTRDGMPVLFHDATLERACGRPVAVADLTLEQLSQVELAPGVWVPTLADVLHAFPGANLMIDIKDPAAIAPVADLVDSFGAAARSCFTGGWDRHLKLARDRLPAAQSNLGWGRMTSLIVCGRTRLKVSRFGSGATFVHLPFRLGRFQSYVPRLVHAAHDLDLRVMVWGIEDPATMHRLLDEGVDGLITDRPDLLRDVLIAREQWTRPGDLAPVNPGVTAEAFAPRSRER